jgi:hypothetical protein
MKASLQSIYTDLSGHYNTEKKTVPNAIYMKIGDDVLSQSSEAVITMKFPLRNPGVMGDDVAIGTEEGAVTKTCKIYRNNCRKVVSTPGYGTDKLDADYLKLFEKHVDDLAPWNKDQEDLEIHQAIVETFGETLIYGETAGKCIRNFNPNIFIAGLGAHNPTQPVYNTNPAVYAQNISAAVSAVNGGGGAILDQTALSNLSNFALKKRISRLDIPGIPGGKGYVLTISELQSMYLGDPAWSARNLGNLYLQRTALPEKVMNWPGVIGAYKDLLIVTDLRAPTVLIDGGSVTAGYMWHGDTDKRHRGISGALDVAALHGRGAVWKWEPEKLHSIKQEDDYGKIKGVGTACVRGIGIPIFDQQVPGVNTHEQFSSVIAFCGMPGDMP